MAVSKGLSDFAATLQGKVQAYAQAYAEKYHADKLAEMAAELEADEADGLKAVSDALDAATTLAPAT